VSESIKDGATGNVAKVGTTLRLHTAATTETAATQAAINGDQFSISSQVINLTSTSQSALFFLQNDEAEDIDWAVTSITVTSAASTGGSGKWLVNFSANSSAGTLLSAGTNINPQNLRVGSAKPLAATAKEGVEGSTLTGGNTQVPIMIPISPGALAGEPDVVVIPQGTSIGIFVTPQTGNTSVDITVSVGLYRIIGD